MTYILYELAALGVCAIGVFAFGLYLYLDISDFDNTRGGYEAPYTEATRAPVDCALNLLTLGIMS